MKKKILTNQKENKGITLIALVITIIVLLILAAVSITTLTGENGILTKAGDAKTATEIAEVKERVQTDILGEQAENRSGNIKKGRLVEILEDYFDNVPTAEELPEDLSTLTLKTKAEYGSHAIKISDIYNGTFEGEDINTVPAFDENTLTIGEALNTDKYGWKVPEYTVITDEFTTGVWRLFYQDSNYTYLITDECVGSYEPRDHYDSYTNGSYVSTIGQKLNPMLLEAGGFFTESNTNTNIRATAWFTDPTQWNSYANENAVFAIGSPTAELYVASFNATASSNGANTITLGVGNYGYTHNTEFQQLKTTYNNGIYNKSTSSYWWLGSPSNGNGSGELHVRGGLGSCYSSGVGNNSNAVRPLVCIPTSVFQSNYTLENV